MRNYWRQDYNGTPVWLCLDEDGSEVGWIRIPPDLREISGYDQAAVETVLRRRWGLSIADLEAELQAGAQRVADEHAKREAADAVLQSFLIAENAARPTTVVKTVERLEALEAVVRELIKRIDAGG